MIKEILEKTKAFINADPKVIESIQTLEPSDKDQQYGDLLLTHTRSNETQIYTLGKQGNLGGNVLRITVNKQDSSFTMTQNGVSNFLVLSGIRLEEPIINYVLKMCPTFELEWQRGDKEHNNYSVLKSNPSIDGIQAEISIFFSSFTPRSAEDIDTLHRLTKTGGQIKMYIEESVEGRPGSIINLSKDFTLCDLEEVEPDSLLFKLYEHVLRAYSHREPAFRYVMVLPADTKMHQSYLIILNQFNTVESIQSISPVSQN